MFAELDELCVGLAREGRAGRVEHLRVVLFGDDAAQSDEEEVRELAEPELHAAQSRPHDGRGGEPLDERAVVVEEGGHLLPGGCGPDGPHAIGERAHRATSDHTAGWISSMDAMRARR